MSSERRKRNHYVGTTGVPLYGWTIEAAVRLGGRPGWLYLHPDQRADLERDPEAGSALHGLGLTVTEGPPVERINGGLDWLGMYVSTTGGVVYVCSVAPRAGDGERFGRE